MILKRKKKRAMRAHTNQEYEAELKGLKDLLLSMGGRCEQMVANAVKALETRDSELAQQVIDADRQMNADELAVDDLAVRILALRQPVGRDLRTAVTAVKLVTDLERIGDEAVNVAERAKEIVHQDGLSKLGTRISEMAVLSTQMLRDALNSFVEEDVKKAQSVFEQDDAVDNLYVEVLRTASEYMKNDPSRIDDGRRLEKCAKYLERIGDHATNIAEMVIFLVDGIDVRHGGS